MALVINTNVASINAQKNLRRTDAPLNEALQRLSSGLRINSAKDDAAGLAIATRQTRQINGLTVAMRNANDGVSFAQTAEGAMDEMLTSVQRIYELAEQSASHNTAADRDSLNQEVQELISEMERIVTQTRYNGEQFLNRQKSINIQVGTEVGETINVSTANVSPDTMGIATNFSDTLGGLDIAKASVLSRLTAGGLAGTATLEGIDLGDAIASADLINNSQALIDRINENTTDTGVTAFSYGNSLVANNVAMATAAVVGNVDAGFMTVNGVQIGSFDGATGLAGLLAAVNAKTGSTGVTAHYVDISSYTVLTAANASSVMVFTNTDGAAINVSVNSAVAFGSAITTHLASQTMGVEANQNGMIIFNDSFADQTMTVDSVATGGLFGIADNTGTAPGAALTLTPTSISNVSITSAAGANVAILAAKESLEVFVAEKAKLGAKLNRMETTIRNIESTRENLTAARSRIMDADFAAETAKLTKAQILQQAGISILAQANQLPQAALSLLQ